MKIYPFSFNLRCIPLFFALVCTLKCACQIVQRPRPESWSNLVPGGRFIDRFLPMQEGDKNSGIWGAKGVKSRFVSNGIEDQDRSYWGGNILFDKLSDKYHLFVCGWDEKSSRGHHQWPHSIVYHTISDSLFGPFRIVDTIGRGHNPEIFHTNEGKFVLYVIDGRYKSNSLNGPWVKDTFEFDRRDRRIIEGLSNLTFTGRRDGSYISICRGGGIWFSKNGITTFNQVTDKRVYPAVEGEFEDPVIWRDHVQYNLIVNDWLGRIAYYLRSPDGVRWITDPGEAYNEKIAFHKDGKEEAWFKFERMKVFQDKHGRAILANFAVIDVLKNDDKGGDNHSSKNIAIPLNRGLLLSYLGTSFPKENDREITIKIHAEPGFNPNKDLDLSSLRFGSSNEVNFGRGSKVINSKSTGNDLLVKFDAENHGMTTEEFAPKLLGKKTNGEIIYGYSQVPWIDYHPSILSARKPYITTRGDSSVIEIVVENFGEKRSKSASLKMYRIDTEKELLVGIGNVKPLNPFGKTTVHIKTIQENRSGMKSGQFKIVISAPDNSSPDFRFET